MNIKSSMKDYEIHFCYDGKKMIDLLLTINNAYWVIDSNVYKYYGCTMLVDIPLDRLMTFEAVETNKCLDAALEICEKMTVVPEKRNATLISIGGGITQDTTGFAANILYRGIHWIFIPTTLLAACDSCIGGKTSLNYGSYKNLLGTFFPPEKIYIILDMFKTLNEKDYLSGLGEVIKFNLMAGEDGLNQIEFDMDKLLNRDLLIIERYVKQSLEFKKKYIEIDEFDRGERVKLNYAHTFGHAFETLSNYEIPHGTAVAMGMIVANRISYNRKWLKEELVNRMENILRKVIKIKLNVIEDDGKILFRAIKKDKKQVDDRITAVLMHQNMALEIVHDVTKEEILSAVSKMKVILNNEN